MTVLFLEATAEQRAAVIEHNAILAAPHFQFGDIDLTDRDAVISRLICLGHSERVALAIADRTLELAAQFGYMEWETGRFSRKKIGLSQA